MARPKKRVHKSTRSTAQIEEMAKRGFIPPGDAAKILVQKVQAVYRAIRRGDLEFEIVGKRYYVKKESAEKYAGVLSQPSR